VDLLGRLTPRATLAIAVLVASGSGCAVGDAPPPAAAPPEEASGAASAQVAARVGSVVPEPPTRIQLPDGTTVRIRAVGTTHNGLLDVPANIRVAGWWSGGSRLGDPFGSTMLAAHVDSRTQGLGPFAGLLTVRPGARLKVWSEGLEQTFAVTARRLRPQRPIGPGSWLYSPEGPRRLTLVTCAGPYDAARGGYQNLAVIVAEPVGVPVERP
jgi:hypothetical protein